MKTRSLIASAIPILLCTAVSGQEIAGGYIFDSETREPLIGATVILRPGQQGAITDGSGHFSIPANGRADSLYVSYIGYEKRTIAGPSSGMAIALTPLQNSLQQVMITANREAALRTESPIAISKLSQVIINDTKPILMAELINKVPGVVMLNYNNEQHAMAIRQPMGTSPYFLYLEDGLPIRPMGIFNHNALIEMNVFGVSAIEVVKGPASSLYGPEAVGGAVNMITHRPTAIPTAKLGLQADQWGYRRIQYAAGGTVGKKLGLYVTGLEGRQRNAWQTYSDYDKSSVSARLDYSLSGRTTLTAAFSGHEYYSDMAGSVDSTSFYTRGYTSTTDFTFRKVHSQRTRLSLSHQWDKGNETELTLAYRDNFIEQNPNYGIRWTSGSVTATGERNRNTFTSKVAQLQHHLRFPFLGAKLMTGASVDYSPTNYWSYRIDLAATPRPDGKSVERYTIIQEHPDSYLSNYRANLQNYAAYTQFEISPLERLKLTAALRYDKMSFIYENHLDGGNGTKSYEQWTPKAGATLDLHRDKGVYVNYSEGFSPPGLTTIFRKRPAPTSGESEFYYDLEPARFNNFEVGGWAALANNKIYLDIAAYHMIGHRELLNIRQQDNSTDYQSAGKTLHRGVEYGVTYRPGGAWLIRFGGTHALHRFEEFTLSYRSTDEIKNVNGKEMPQSPRWIANSEVTYKPEYARGLTVSLEWQRIGSWYQDQVNHVKYDDRGFLGLKGVSYLNFRAGYAWHGLEIFSSVMNLTDELYAHSATRGNSANDRTTYTPAAPRTFVFGAQYTFTGKSGEE